MKVSLKTQVLLLTTLQVLYEISGMIVTIMCPQCRGVISVEELLKDAGTEFRDNALSGNSITYKDYSHLESSHYYVYVLPHLFSGVVPRMVDGFKCITADQLMLEYLTDWEKLLRSLKKDPREHIILTLSEAYQNQPKLIKELETNIDEALALRRIHCTAQKDSLIVLQLVAMVASTVSALLLLIISSCDKVLLPRLHIPWMVFSAFEITGNVCIAIAFIIFPGLPYLVVLICMCKVLWLRWVWVRLVRRQMHQQMEQHDRYIALMVKGDHERKLLRSELSKKGRIRLSRVFGSYV